MTFMSFAAVYVLIGLLVSIAVIMTEGNLMLRSLGFLMRHEGMDFGPVVVFAVLTVLTVLYMLAWPVLIARR